MGSEWEGVREQREATLPVKNLLRKHKLSVVMSARMCGKMDRRWMGDMWSVSRKERELIIKNFKDMMMNGT